MTLQVIVQGSRSYIMKLMPTSKSQRWALLQATCVYQFEHYDILSLLVCDTPVLTLIVFCEIYKHRIQTLWRSFAQLLLPRIYLSPHLRVCLSTPSAHTYLVRVTCQASLSWLSKHVPLLAALGPVCADSTAGHHGGPSKNPVSEEWFRFESCHPRVCVIFT